MIILGIDPGLTKIGYGLIQKNNSRLTYHQAGLLHLPMPPQKNQLLLIENELKKFILKIKPTAAGLEKLYFVKNQKTGLAVAQARGVILAALLKTKIPIIELTPTQIKISVTGYGRASKKAIEKMVRSIIKLPARPFVDDAIDALAIAIAAADHLKTLKTDDKDSDKEGY